MKKIIFFLSLLFIAQSGISHAQVASPWSQQMSGEQKISMPGGKTMTSKIFVDNGKVRTDINIEGMNVSSIILPEKKMLYTLMHAQKMLIEVPLTGQSQEEMNPLSQTNVKFEPVGSENIGGIDCEKYKLAVAGGKGQFFWINKQTKLPVKMQSEDGTMKIEWLNTVAGPQPASLFEIPAGYQKMQVPAMPH